MKKQFIATKKRIASFLAGMVTMALIISTVMSALAISGRMSIEVDPINIQVNGATFQPKDATGADVPVFAYNGTTYAPLRALAEAYGLDVWYDSASNVAAVGAKGTAPTQPSINTPSVNTVQHIDFTTLAWGGGVNKTDESLVLGEEKDLSVIYLPSNIAYEFSWTSSNPEVVSIVNPRMLSGDEHHFPYATIKAVGAGISTVMAVAPDGQSLTMPVTVSENATAYAQEAVYALKRELKNPSSLVLNSVRAVKPEGGNTFIEIDYSAMNGFGGYNRRYFIYPNQGISDKSAIAYHNYSYEEIDLSALK